MYDLYKYIEFPVCSTLYQCVTFYDRTNRYYLFTIVVLVSTQYNEKVCSCRQAVATGNSTARDLFVTYCTHKDSSIAGNVAKQTCNTQSTCTNKLGGNYMYTVPTQTAPVIACCPESSMLTCVQDCVLIMHNQVICMFMFPL